MLSAGFGSKQEEGNYLKTVKEQRAESFTGASAADREEVEQRRGGGEGMRRRLQPPFVTLPLLRRAATLFTDMKKPLVILCGSSRPPLAGV